jgi:hypothetical protein
MDIKQTNSNHSDQNSDILKRNIIEEINALNQQMQNSSNEIYKVSSSWDKQPNAQNNKNIEVMIKEIMNYVIKMDTTLTRIDTTLTKIEAAFSNNKKRNKCEIKSFWDNLHL